MPQFESLWAEALLRETSYTKETALAGLLARFGTGAALPSVVEKLSKKRGAVAVRSTRRSLGLRGGVRSRTGERLSSKSGDG